MTIYDVDYFIQKFEAIPEEKWTAGMYYNSETEACCVLGHCGDRIEVNGGGSREWCALKVIFNNISANPVRVNDDVLEKVYRKNSETANSPSVTAD